MGDRVNYLTDDDLNDTARNVLSLWRVIRSSFKSAAAAGGEGLTAERYARLFGQLSHAQFRNEPPCRAERRGAPKAR